MPVEEIEGGRTPDRCQLPKPPVVMGQQRRKTNNKCAVNVVVPSTKVLAIVVGRGGNDVLVFGGCHRDIV